MVLLPLSAHALSLEEAVEQALRRHPDITLARLAPLLDQAVRLQLEGMLDGRLGLTAAASDSRIRTVSPFAARQITDIQFGYRYDQPLENGDRVGVGFAMVRDRQKFPASLPQAFQPSLNPLYQSQVDFSWRKRLLKGRGNPDYHEQLARNRASEEADRWRISVVRHQLAGQVVAAFFQQRIDRIQVRLARDARDRARKLLRYQRHREAFGLIEPADRLQSEALLATRTTELAQAEAALAASRVVLQRLLGSDRPPTRLVLVDGGAPSSPPPLAELERIARRHRPEFRMLQAQLAAADAALALARAEDRPQLDLVAQVGTRAQEGRFERAFRSGLSLSHRFAQLSIEFSDEIGGHAAEGAVRRAELQREQVEAQIAQAARKVGDDLAAIRTRIASGRKLLHGHAMQVAAERRKFAAEMARYRAGRSDTATVIQFEGDLRRAELQQALQREALRLAEYQLKLARGDWPVVARFDEDRSGGRAAAE
ncbi:MAG: TolC family protein [Zetaproteobacteria bacterium]|nr:MAG: TolC family protein [Zetaproteobacteria bacterium]